MKLFEVIIEGRQEQNNFFAMYHITAESIRQVPGIVAETAQTGNFELIRIEETNYLYDVSTEVAGMVGIMRMSPTVAY